MLFQNTVLLLGIIFFLKKKIFFFQGSVDTLMGRMNTESWSKVLQYKAKF